MRELAASTANGSATAPAEYQATSGTLTIPAGSATGTISVPVIGDSLCEAAETFTLQLATPVGATIADASGIATLVDDDPVTVTLAADRTFPAAAGVPITWTAAASGATGPTSIDSGPTAPRWGTWRIVQDYASAASWTWTPASAGTYAVQVWVRSSGSTQASDGYAGSGSFDLTPAAPVAVTSFTANRSFPVAAGTPITWTATASGGATPLQYQFHLYDPTSGWRVLRGYGVANTVTWTPLHPGDYALQVWVRAPGSAASYDAWASSGTASITAGPVAVVSFGADRLLPLAPGTTVTWTAQAAGGASPLEYRFVYYRASLGTWVEGQAYGPSPTWTWTPPAADTYVVQVWVRTVGSPASYEAWSGTDYFQVASGPVQGLELTTPEAFPLAPHRRRSRGRPARAGARRRCNTSSCSSISRPTRGPPCRTGAPRRRGRGHRRRVTSACARCRCGCAARGRRPRTRRMSGPATS